MVSATFGAGNSLDAWRLQLSSVSRVLAANTPSEVIPLLNAAEEAARSGLYVAVMLSYEAAPAFEVALKTHEPQFLPLAWAACFSAPADLPAKTNNGSEVVQWEPQLSRSEYETAVAEIRELISAGDTYQVNYSFPLKSIFNGDPFRWYRELCQAQTAAYCAYLDTGRYQILSLSPELFFERHQNVVRTKPMKGTVKRGRWQEEDEQLADWLQTSAKNRAENVMIVDLLRNDLGKVSETGSVTVRKLFELERFETLWQLTSTVESTVSENTSLAQLLSALFPCGSITGAPKIRTMEIIRHLERFPRGPYTGTIGLLKPNGDWIFNVAIRTLVVDSETKEATFGVGGGITFDSTAETEYEECLIKSKFLVWKPPAFHLFESVLLEDGVYFLLPLHLERLRSSADFLGFPYPDTEINSVINQIARDHSSGKWKVRLDLLRAGTIESAISTVVEEKQKIRRVTLATAPVDPSDRLLFHKTTHRTFYDLQLSQRPHCDDIISWNLQNEVTESTIANVVISLGGELFTPPIDSGLLPGVFRRQLIAESKIQERRISIEELRTAEQVFLINSVRKWMPVEIVD